ncbi:MAG: N-acetyl sugar amidotransferase [Deltaproteobacteria bacterium]|nr:N-acetyl sugar amidotransferase [Deltaproteobacteria bacterium]MBW2063915.1 N-acetyl sugar amidotransferase [Deltaproteobacteria bacterium]
MNKNKGGPPYEDLQYCVRCCMPETNEGEKFDELGICQACQASEEKMHINWVEREQRLREILEYYKSRSGDNYDCIVPISGGKDSCFQLHIVKRVYGMKPLAVTFSHNWFSEEGNYNLRNILEKLNIDHLMFTPNRELVNRLAKESLYKIGDVCWHCHAGVGAFPLQVAVKFNIPLIIWGESIAETSGRAKYTDDHLIKFDRDYFTRVSAKLFPEEMVNDEISSKDLFPFQLPSAEEMERVGVVGIHLGNYIFWDAERQVEFLVREYGWREGKEMDGTYKKYKSVECIMHGMHDYTKYLKRGFGRATDHACQDVRAGIITREEGFELIKKYDPMVPRSFHEYLRITGLSEEEFHRVMEHHRDLVVNKRQEILSDKLRDKKRNEK